MSFKHSTFLFDYAACREDLLDMLKIIEQGNTDEVYRRVRAIRKRIGRPKRWVLHNKGTYFNSNSSEPDADRNHRLGHWLLIILSTYLKPLPSLDYRGVYLASLLHALGWSPDEISELFYGYPIETLLYPDFKITEEPAGDFCWVWIKPERARNAHWLSDERISSLRELLIGAREKFHDLNPPMPVIGGEAGTYAEMEALFKIVLDNFDLAESQNLGLYSVRYLED